MPSFRQKLINEVLDEDRNVNRRVVDNLFKQVKVYNDIKQPQTVNDAVSLDFLFKRIDEFASQVTEAIEKVVALPNVPELDSRDSPDRNIPQYNMIMNSRYTLLQKNNKAKSIIDAKLQSLLPVLNSVVVALDNSINAIIKGYELNLPIVPQLEDDLQGKKFANSFALLMSTFAIYLLYRDNISVQNYTPIDLQQVDVEFNKLVQSYPAIVRTNIAWSLLNSPLGGYRDEYKKLLTTETRNRETELGRPLTKNEALLLGIRVGGFKEFLPVLTQNDKKVLEHPHRDYPETAAPPPSLASVSRASTVQDSEAEEPEDEEEEDDDSTDVRHVSPAASAAETQQVVASGVAKSIVLPSVQVNRRETAYQNQQVRGNMAYDDSRNDQFKRRFKHL